MEESLNICDQLQTRLDEQAVELNMIFTKGNKDCSQLKALNNEHGNLFSTLYSHKYFLNSNQNVFFTRNKIKDATLMLEILKKDVDNLEVSINDLRCSLNLPSSFKGATPNRILAYKC